MSFTAVGSAKASTRVRQSKFSDFALSSFLACILAAGPSAYALPAGGVVTGGSGTIS